VDFYPFFPHLLCKGNLHKMLLSFCEKRKRKGLIFLTGVKQGTFTRVP